MAEIKADYDRAVTRVQKMTKAYDRQAEEFRKLRREYRLADRYSRKAEARGMLDELQHWRKEADHLHNSAMPVFINNLGRLYDELEKAIGVVESYRLEISVAAGISDGYGANIKIVDKRGGFDIYFGGVGTPDGPGHGHYAFKDDFKCSFRREPLRQKPLPRWRQ